MSARRSGSGPSTRLAALPRREVGEDSGITDEERRKIEARQAQRAASVTYGGPLFGGMSASSTLPNIVSTSTAQPRKGWQQLQPIEATLQASAVQPWHRTRRGSDRARRPCPTDALTTLPPPPQVAAHQLSLYCARVDHAQRCGEGACLGEHSACLLDFPHAHTRPRCSAGAAGTGSHLGAAPADSVSRNARHVGPEPTQSGRYSGLKALARASVWTCRPLAGASQSRATSCES
jgi:hypothetical protein